MRGYVFHGFTVVAALLLGCRDAERDSGSATKSPSAPALVFDRGTAGRIHGRVIWEGDAPAAPPLAMRTDPPVARGKSCPNPNLPVIDAESRGVVQAVVFLRDVDAGKARPWDHPPVRVEMRDLTLHVRQGETDSCVGFVRAGDAIEMVSRERVLHGLEGRGAAFFSLRFADAEVVASRVLTKKGVVDLTSAVGYSWMRAHLFVDEHPYYVRTDQRGQFELAQVPTGRYRVVCWMPDWHIVRKEREPENSLVNRLVFAAPLEVEHDIIVEANADREVTFKVSAAMFAR